jgi:hypothetical protein
MPKDQSLSENQPNKPASQGKTSQPQVIEKNPFLVLDEIASKETPSSLFEARKAANEFVENYPFSALSAEGDKSGSAKFFARVLSVAMDPDMDKDYVHPTKGDKTLDLSPEILCRIFDQVIDKLVEVNPSIAELPEVIKGKEEAVLARVRHNLSALIDGHDEQYFKYSLDREDLYKATDYLDKFAKRLKNNEVVEFEEVDKAIEVLKAIANHKSGDVKVPKGVTALEHNQGRLYHRTCTLMALESLESVFMAHKEVKLSSRIPEVNFDARKNTTSTADKMWEEFGSIRSAITKLSLESVELNDSQRVLRLSESVKNTKLIADRPRDVVRHRMDDKENIRIQPLTPEAIMKHEDIVKMLLEGTDLPGHGKE